MTTFNKHPLAGKNEIDSAFSGIWDFYKRWFLPMYAISFVMMLITTSLSSRFDANAFQGVTQLAEIAEIAKLYFGVLVVILIVSLFFSILLQYYIIMKPLDAEFSFGDAALKVLTKFYLPILIVSVLIGIFAVFAFLVGALLFIVGLFFAIPYVFIFASILTPLMIIEQTSIGDSLTRLFKLAHNKFWQNMAWVSIYIVLLAVFSLIVNAIIMLPFSGNFFGAMFNPDLAAENANIAKNPAYIILSSLVRALTTPILPLLGLVLYFNNSQDESSHNINSLAPNRDNELEQEQDKYDNDFKPTVDDLTP